MADERRTRICPNCGKTSNRSISDCSNCGYKFTGDEGVIPLAEIPAKTKTSQWITIRPFVILVCIILLLAIIIRGSILANGNNDENTENVINRYQGLGTAIKDWEQSHNKDINSDETFYLYDNNRFALMNYEGKICHLEITWGDDDALTFEDAKAEASKYIPSDSHLVETYIPQENRVVERYTSSSLAPLFDELAWLGSPPGEFIIIYREYEFGVSSVVITLGNNP
jgi:hypothetical protein